MRAAALNDAAQTRDLLPVAGIPHERRITACCSAYAMTARRRIRFKPSRASPEALKETLDLMGLTEDDARRIFPIPAQPPDPT